ncbi:MAG: ATP-binding cassette domain-containing protein [Bdellovibrionales bacterium]|nr:ATP-binding cassette domain-containing protein [Bdellovibrionales bacterium]NQZ18078.1 ATP-binding cassette domain-containing protein [Bdellovibrionales bacterium]
MLRVQGVQKYFHSHPIFQPIDFLAEPGTVTLIKGPNGSGKTTLLKGLSGHLTFENGQVDFISSTDQKNKELTNLSSLALSQENGFFPQLTIQQNIIFFSNYFSSTDDISALTDRLQLQPWLQKKFQECSTGIKKRVVLLRSLLPRPKILLIDEPFSNMDKVFCKDLALFINSITMERQTVTIITSHQKTPKTLNVHQKIKVLPCSTL